jgi:hypothetical protein
LAKVGATKKTSSPLSEVEAQEEGFSVPEVEEGLELRPNRTAEVGSVK